MKLLEKLYLIHSPSRGEAEMSKFVQAELTRLGRKFIVDQNNQIYWLGEENTPLLSAHLDQVQKDRCTKVVKSSYKLIPSILAPVSLSPPGPTLKISGPRHPEGTMIWGSDTGLGADDKNGIWIVLQLLKEKQFNFIFSVQEECGGGPLRTLLQTQGLEEQLNKLPYALVFDRRNAGDIIGVSNDYCCPEFEAAIEATSLDGGFGYSPAHGTFSDANALSDYLSCVNLSCGYYDAHSVNEYTVISELENALAFAKSIVTSVTEKFPKPDKPEVVDFWSSRQPWARDFRRLKRSPHAATPNFCPECLWEMDPGDRWCPVCFAPVDEDLPPFPGFDDDDDYDDIPDPPFVRLMSGNIDVTVDTNEMSAQGRYQILDMLGLREEADEILDEPGAERFKKLSYTATRKQCPEHKRCGELCAFAVAPKDSDCPDELWLLWGYPEAVMIRTYTGTCSCKHHSASLVKEAVVVDINVAGFNCRGYFDLKSALKLIEEVA